MRLDKFLKVSRIIKRRTIANEACDAERVLVNGKPQRASYAVKVGDILEIQMGAKPFKAEITQINEYAKKEDAGLMYKVIE
ncbi:MAG: RNA-binding S4 domain-containing protein [Acutalibacteraceae bacterium]|nr:RNA-binding S4 domain-containing protein [Acutalibacteraceae bacterium]MEE1282227.1 RNA-binding S4 domain-containing protein [Acutalibacteraceae bacterium]